MTDVLIGRSVYAVPYLDRGIARLRQNDFALAVANFDMALCFAPDNPYAHWNKATALLSMGDYINGFAEHEWGWRLFSWRGFGPVKDDIDRLKALPLWRGESEVRLLVYHELGFGDAIMCFRYLPELQRRAKVTLVVDQCLARLARRFDVEVVTTVPNGLGGFDYRLPFFSAMSVLRQTVETIPRAPYIAANWQRTGGKIGIVWSGRTQTMFSASHFISMLRRCAGYRLQSLQLENNVPPDVQPLEAKDFADTVKVIERMDHIVTVDTAVAHLAGAMGHPSIHLILPFMSDWRWWNAAAWYPTIKVYRQSQAGNDWALPFAQVSEALNFPNCKPKE